MVASRSSTFRLNTQAGCRACDEVLLWHQFKNEACHILARWVRTALPNLQKLVASGPFADWKLVLDPFKWQLYAVQGSGAAA